MKAIKIILVLYLFFFCTNVRAQVKTDFNSELISAKGRFEKVYNTDVNLQFAAKDIANLVEIERKELAKSAETKPFQLAVPIVVDLNIAKLIDWSIDKDYD